MTMNLRLTQTETIWVIVHSVLFGILAYLSLNYTLDHQGIAAIWLPNAIIVAAMLNRTNANPLIICAAFLGNVFANLGVGETLHRAAALALTNSLEITFIWLGMRRLVSVRPDAMRYDHLVHFTLIAGLIVPFISSGLAALILDTTATSMANIWFSRFLTHSLGMMTVAPAIWIAGDEWQKRAWPDRKRIAEWVAILGSGLLVMITVFSQTRYPLLFLATPFIFLSAFRMGALGASAAIMIVAAIAWIATAQGLGPIALMGGNLPEQFYVLQGFVAVNFMMSLPIAAVLASRSTVEQELREARTVAEQAVVAKSAFLANMSHEIRTPMNGVIGFTDLLLAGNLDADQRRQIGLVAESGKSMMQLLNSILDVSKIEAGQLQITEEPVNLRHTVRSIIRMMEPAAQAKGIVLRSHVKNSVPRSILIDPLKFRQILINLVGNAIKFTEEGQVELIVGTKTDAEGAMLSVEVKDSGIGIPADRIDTIFTAFTQADNSIVRRFGGTGLGLTITSQLVDLMGGTISVFSKEQKGSTFAATLPLREAPEEHTSCKIVDSLLPTELADIPPCRVLIAEDNDINQALMRAMMATIGLNPLFASNGIEAVDFVTTAAAAGKPFDLILMDMQMPVMDGVEATRRLREAGFDAKTLPIVALTANAYAEDIAACRQAGMQDHLSKPVTLATIREMLTRFTPAEPFTTLDPVSEPPQTHVEKMSASLITQYQHRKVQTIAQAELLAQQTVISDTETEQFIDQLHKLAGTAGFFGDASLGTAASHLEHKMQLASIELRPRVVLAGLAGLSNA